MKTINSTTQTTDILSLKDFCDLTRKAYRLKYFPTDTIVDKTNGWTKLADMWVALIDEEDIDLFSDVAYSIKWGIPAENPLPEYQALVNATSDALLFEGPAREAWITHEHCKSVIFETAYEYNPWISGESSYSTSRSHHRYTMSKMLLRVLNYSKGHITKCKEFASYIRFYEERIIKLLPHAEHWSAEYWLNENNIFDELMKVCHFDYRSDITSYNSLLRLASSPKRIPTDRDWYTAKCASNVKAFSTCWAKAIWPKKTNDAIIQLLLVAEKEAEEAYKNPKENRFTALYDPMLDIDYTLLSQSWLFSYTSSLQANQEIPLVAKNQVKQALFNIVTRS